MDGGELFQRIQDHNEGAFTERGKFKRIINNKKYLTYLIFFV